MKNPISESKPPRLDVCIVSGRRPELLARTLASFQKNLFRFFDVDQVYANIDPVFGDLEEHAACRNLILEQFPNARITEPHAASFGQAVKTLWSQADTNLIFHLEDDWIALDPITPEMVFPLIGDKTIAVVPVSKEVRWNGRDVFHMGVRKKKWMGITLLRRRVRRFGTCPRFLDPGFARHVAALLISELDPEKQIGPRFNPKLVSFLMPFECRLLPGTRRPEIIEDIGREWRAARSIEKTVVDGTSIWTKSAA